MSLRRLAIIALLGSAAACVGPKPAPTPAPSPRPTVVRPTPTPAPVATYSSWMDVPQTAGDWRFGATSGGSEARFGEPVSFTLRCVAGSRSIELIRSGTFAADGSMTVRSESVSRALAGARTSDNAGLRAVLSASDPLLDAMAFSKGRFAIEAAGVPPLYLPSWPEVTRVIEDCR